MASRVLIVEDSSSMRSLIASSLPQDVGIEVVEVGSAFEALKVLPSGSFSLILTDINMPDISGLELVAFVKNHPVHKKIPIVIISTEKSEADRKRGLDLGAEEYMVKPFTTSELQRVVERFLPEVKGSTNSASPENSD